VVFGGEKKLALAIRELADRYHPLAVFVYSTCIVGVIGDDLLSVCKKAAEELGIPVVPVKSEGFRGNKNEGYKGRLQCARRADRNQGLRASLPRCQSPGEYNVAGDLWSVKPLFEEMGIEVVASLTGDARVADIEGTALRVDGDKEIRISQLLYRKYGLMKMSIDLWGAIKQLDWAVFAVKI